MVPHFFSHQYCDISSFKIFLQVMNSSTQSENNPAKLCWVYFNCTFSGSYYRIIKICSSGNSLEWLQWHSFELSMNDQSYSMYNAVYAVTHNLHEMLLHHVDMYNEERLVYLPCQVRYFASNARRFQQGSCL